MEVLYAVSSEFFEGTYSRIVVRRCGVFGSVRGVRAIEAAGAFRDHDEAFCDRFRL